MVWTYTNAVVGADGISGHIHNCIGNAYIMQTIRSVRYAVEATIWFVEGCRHCTMIVSFYCELIERSYAGDALMHVR